MSLCLAATNKQLQTGVRHFISCRRLLDTFDLSNRWRNFKATKGPVTKKNAIFYLNFIERVKIHTSYRKVENDNAFKHKYFYIQHDEYSKFVNEHRS